MYVVLISKIVMDLHAGNLTIVLLEIADHSEPFQCWIYVLFMP